MEFKDLKKQICWFWKTDPNGRNKKEKEEPVDKVLSLNAREKKGRNNNIKFFKGEYNKCGKYGHRESDCWGNKNYNRNNKNTERDPLFNWECNNCGKIGHRNVDCWENKRKQKDNDVDNLFAVAKFRGEVQEEKNEEDTK